MKKLIGVALLASLFLITPTTAEFLTEEQKTIEISQMLDESTVSIIGKGQGSGFYIEEDLILTSQHVVGDLPFIFIKDGRGKTWTGKVIYSETNPDLAVIQSNQKGKPLVLASTYELGQSVLVVGFPVGELFVSKGIISNVRNEGYILHDALTDRGNSGGAVVNLNGEVVGVTKGSFIDNRLMSAAVALGQIKQFMKRLSTINQL